MATGRIYTRMTKILNIVHPVVLAPMGGISGPRLAVAVSDCGGIGFVGSGNQSRISRSNKGLYFESQLYELQVAKELSHKPDNIGIGLIVKGQLEKDPSILENVLELKPKNIWLSFGSVSNISIFAKKIHSYPDIRLFVQCESVEEARTATDMGASVIILRGQGAGGAFSSKLLPYLADFIPATREAIEKDIGIEHCPLIIAAGGVSTGKDLAYCLDLGADGVCLGTRMAATMESDLSDEEKESMLDMKVPFVVSTNPNQSHNMTGVGIHNINYINSAKDVIEGMILEARIEAISRKPRPETKSFLEDSIYICD